MKTKFWKSITSFLFLLLFCLQNGVADDVRLKIPESTVNNIFGAITESKYLSYGISDAGGYVNYYSIKLQSASLDVNAGNTFSLTLVVDAVANFNAELFDFDLVLTGQSITVTGAVSLQTQGTGYKVTFVPQTITYNTNNWLKNVINVAISGLISKLPEISTSSSQPLLPDIASSYFTSGTPTLSTTSTEIILGLTLASGPRYISVQNEVNQRIDLGNVQEVISGTPSTLYQSPKTYEWNTGLAKLVQTPNELIVSTNGQNKYMNWFNLKFPTTPLPDVVSRRIQILVGSDDATYSAKFPHAQHVQISNYLVEAGVSAGTSTYHFSNGGQISGTIIDNYDFTNGTGVATAIGPGEYNGYNYGFYNWSDGNTSQSRNIIVNNDVNLTANYKKVLYSSSVNATGPNNQRKIAQIQDGTYILVYERDNKILFSKSTDGTHWSYETEIVAGDGSNIVKSPSIVFHENSNTVTIVWQRMDAAFYGSGFELSDIYLRTYNNDNNTWSSSDLVASFNPSSANYEAMPVVAGWDYQSKRRVVVLWRTPSGLAARAHVDGSWSSIVPVPNTNSNCLYPSITRRFENTFALCWQNTNFDRIDYIELDYYGSLQFDTESAYSVSPGGWGFNQYPSIAVNGDKTVIVTWLSFDNVVEGQSVHVKEKPVNGGWGGITSWSANATYGTKPIVGTFLDLSSYYVLWEMDGDIYSVHGLGTTWSPEVILASGSSGGTNISAVNRSKSAVREIWKKSNGSFALHNSGLSKSSSTVAHRLNKHMLNYLDSIPELAQQGYKGMVAFEIAGLTKESGANKITMKTEKHEQCLRSNTINVATNSDVIKLAGAYYAKELEIPENAKYNEIAHLVTVTLKDASTNAVVREVWNVPLSKLTTRTGKNDGQYREIIIPLNGLRNKEVYLDVSFAGNANPVFVDDYYILGKEDERLKKFFEEDAINIPTQYALYQNFPNPFNPSTTIRFDLIEPQNVILKVYNSIGQELKTIVNDYYPEGSHQVAFDASSLSSGVYYYRIVAGDFTKTKSFVLVK